MTTMGERMSHEEVEDLLKEARRDNHQFIEYKGIKIDLYPPVSVCLSFFLLDPISYDYNG